MRYDKKMREAFKRLMVLPVFKQDIQRVRVSLKLPLKPNKKMSRRLWEDVTTESFYFIKKYKLPRSYHGLIVEYIVDEYVLDKDAADTDSLPSRVHRAKVDTYQKDKWSITIYPGAVKSDVVELLKIWWPVMEAKFKIDFPREYKKRIKAKPKRERDEQIGELYDLKVIKADGHFNDINARKYITEKLPNFEGSNIEAFKKLGIELPKSPEGRRKVIRAYNKKK